MESWKHFPFLTVQLLSTLRFPAPIQKPLFNIKIIYNYRFRLRRLKCVLGLHSRIIIFLWSSPLLSIGNDTSERSNMTPPCWLFAEAIQSCTEAEFLDEIQTKISREFSSLLFTVTSTALPWDLYCFKVTQPLTVSVKETGGKPDRKPYPCPYGNPKRNLKS